MPDLDMRYIRYFVETVKTGSMSQAAKRLFVSQQALSKGIKNLEESLGADLFERGVAGVSLTDFGRFFLKRAKLSLSAEELAEKSFEDFQSESRYSITVGVPMACLKDRGGTLGPTSLVPLQEEYPWVTFGIVEATEIAIIAGLNDGSFQFGIGAIMPEATYNHVVLDSFPVVTLVSRENPLSQNDCITARDLATGQVVTPNDSNVKLMVEQLGAESQVTIPISPNHLITVDPADMITDPYTFTIMPEQHARRVVSTERVELVPLCRANGKPVAVELHLSWRKTLPVGEPERAFIDYIVGLYANRKSS